MEMQLLDYCFYALMGLSVVFLALIFLMCILYILGNVEFGGKKDEALSKAAAPAAAGATIGAAAASAPAGKPAPGTAGELKLYDTDPRDAAMVMAIVADELGKPLNELRFTSIREVK